MKRSESTNLRGHIFEVLHDECLYHFLLVLKTRWVSLKKNQLGRDTGGSPLGGSQALSATRRARGATGGALKCAVVGAMLPDVSEGAAAGVATGAAGGAMRGIGARRRTSKRF